MSDENTPQEQGEGCFLPLWVVLIIGGILVGCAVFSIPVFNTLYGIVFPPTAPFPNESVQTEKTTIDHGVEKTRYTTTQNPCQVVQFYSSEGGTCEILWDICDGDQFMGKNRSYIPFAYCEGISPAGAFAVQWEVDIASLYPPQQTTFDVSHEVLWGGMPLPTSTVAIPD